MKQLILLKASLIGGRHIIIQLNRVVAFAKVYGASKALIEIKKLPLKRLDQNYIYHSIYASLLQQTSDTKNALLHYKKALTLTMNQYEKRHLSSRIEAIS